MADYHSFNEEKVNSAISAARRRFEAKELSSFSATSEISASVTASFLAECISVSVKNNEICLNLPLGIGSVCIPVPDWVPEGEAAQACLRICTTWGIPTGVRVSVIIAGITVVDQTFGRC